MPRNFVICEHNISYIFIKQEHVEYVVMHLVLSQYIGWYVLLYKEPGAMYKTLAACVRILNLSPTSELRDQ